jgi:hypothetical protein
LTAHVADDVILGIVETVNRQPATPAGWTLMMYQGTGTPGSAGSTGLTIFGKRAASSAEPALVVNNPASPADQIMAGLLQIRGIPRQIPLSGFITVGSVLAAADTAVTWPNPGESQTDDALVLNFLTHATSTATPQGSGYTNAALANITERQDTPVAIGKGGGIIDTTGDIHIAGPVGSMTAVLATASAQALAVMILPSQFFVPPGFYNQVLSMLANGPPFEIDGLVYTTAPTLDGDCLVFTQVAPTIPGIAAGTTLRFVLPMNAMQVFRAKNAP